MKCKRLPSAAGGLRITAVQESPWYETVALALPQKAVWEIRQDGERLSVYLELRAFGWHLVLLSILFLYVVLAILSAFLATGEDSPRGSPLAVAAYLLPALGLAFVIVRLLGALGGGRQAEALWPAVVAGVEGQGGFLEPAGRPVSLPFAVAILSYVGVFLGLGIWLVWSSSGDAALKLLLQALVATAFVLIVGAVLMITRRGFIVRTVAILAGLCTALSGLLFLSLQLPWWLISQADSPPFLPFLDTGRELMATLEGMNRDDWNPHLAARFASFQTGCRLAVGLTPSIGLLAASLAVYGIYLSIFSWPQLLRIHRHRATGVYRQAVSGGTVLWLFRGIFVTGWLSLSGFIFAVQGLALANACQALAPIWSHPQLRLAELTAGLTAVALGRPVGDPWLEAVVRAGWLAFGLTTAALMTISAGQLLLSQRAGRCALRSAARSPAHPGHHTVAAMLAARCREVRCGKVHLAVTPGASLPPSAVVFGLWPAERFIEISPACLDLLDDEELEALVAHELAHHLEGHCRLDQLLRWLGRLTLVGDGFVLALQDSWGYERRADRVAVARLGVSSETLSRGLKKLRNAGAAARLAGEERGAADALGFPALPRSEERGKEPDDLAKLLDGGPSALGWQARWRLAWRLFRHQYFSAMDVHYWHPGTSDRERALLASDALDRARGHARSTDSRRR